MKTDQDLLKEYIAAGDTHSAARLLQHLTKNDRASERRYPDPRTLKEGKSADWQITRSHAMQAIIKGSFSQESLLAIHLLDAFTSRDESETLEERKQRAIEVLEACLEGVKNAGSQKEWNFFRLVDAAADFAIASLLAGVVPTNADTLEAARKTANAQPFPGSEGTKIMKAAHLQFLPRRKGKHSPQRQGMKVGFKRPRN